jgi:hypothetical protein
MKDKRKLWMCLKSEYKTKSQFALRNSNSWKKLNKIFLCKYCKNRKTKQNYKLVLINIARVGKQNEIKLQIGWHLACRKNRPKSRADSDDPGAGPIQRWARKLRSRWTRPETRERDAIEICRPQVGLEIARGWGPTRRQSRLVPAKTKLRDFG